SVKASNVASIMAQPDVDGGLVGGASSCWKRSIGFASAGPSR
ncbi:triose-phosphate isomerase, partial [Micromonospora sp. NPDC049089]